MVLARLLEVYEQVLIPFGENTRYDLLIEDADEYIRVQCKTGRLVRGSVVFSACSTNFHHPDGEMKRNYRHHYRGQADRFGVYCRGTGAVYLVPVRDVGKAAASLRVEPCLNKQSKRIRWAKDYAIGAAVSS